MILLLAIYETFRRFLLLFSFFLQQMVLMKSHLHGDDGESVEMFFGKLIQVMELAVKQIFSLIDTTNEEVDVGSKTLGEEEYSGQQIIRKDLQVYASFHVLVKWPSLTL